MKWIDGEPAGWDSPEDNFLPGSSSESGPSTGRCKFDSDSPRLVAGLVEYHLGDSCGGDNPEIRAFENIRGEIRILRGNSTPIRAYKVD